MTTKINNNNNKDILTGDGTLVIATDAYLEPYRGALERRSQFMRDWLETIIKHEGSLDAFSRAYERFGLNYSKSEMGIWYREWAPNATQMFLTGDFNQWSRTSHEMESNDFGVFSLFMPDGADGKPAIKHNTKIKCSMIVTNGERIERVPAWSRRVIQDLKQSPVYDALFWNPPVPYKWINKTPLQKPADLRVYEAHVGISNDDGRIGTYKEFTKNMLPRIHDLGYNCIQLMAIMEHAYYASFGYQVTSFFACSSRYGTPEELKELIDTAHGMGIVVLLDLVHSHACINVLDGLNQFDGTDHQYFHEGARGRHELWDSRLFNYGNYEVLRFLLSNCRYWMDEFKFDGFRFDGVTSMLYKHHGIAYGFSGNYEEYFGGLVDEDAVGYLMIANHLVHTLYPNAITIAEDVSGMPTLCQPVQDGGVGFDYRLAMAVPDMWIKMLKEQRDEDWDMEKMVYTLTNRRWQEKTIAYCESHDQALVGDKTLAFWMMDKEMYEFMSDLSPLTPIIERGVALHKMIRLITCGLAGDGYLNFEGRLYWTYVVNTHHIGNEFGHPEWLDFPREGNNDSYHYCRRQFRLADEKLLRYKYLNNFDRAMQHAERKFKWLCDTQYVSRKNQGDRVIVFERGGLVWAFNFHATKSYTDYRIGANRAGKYKVVLDSDANEFLGFGRIDASIEHFTTPEHWDGRDNWLQVYLPSRTAIVMGIVD